MEEIFIRINEKEDLDSVMQVADDVFKPNTEEKEKYHKKSDWLIKINSGLLISALVENKIVGFAVCYRKINTLHIWNVAVLPDYRNFGVWRRMWRNIKFRVLF